MQINDLRKNDKAVAIKADAVNLLLTLANMNCGGSEAAAEVLLCAYNFYDHKLNIGNLCLLDPIYYNAALHVIDLRIRYSIEPHSIIPNGGAIFKVLAKDWAHLRNTTVH